MGKRQNGKYITEPDHRSYSRKLLFDADHVNIPWTRKWKTNKSSCYAIAEVLMKNCPENCHIMETSVKQEINVFVQKTPLTVNNYYDSPDGLELYHTIRFNRIEVATEVRAGPQIITIFIEGVVEASNRFTVAPRVHYKLYDIKGNVVKTSFHTLQERRSGEEFQEFILLRLFESPTFGFRLEFYNKFY